MALITVDLITNEGTFRGLAKQNILFHQCISELVDNSIASVKDGEKFKIDIIFSNKNSDGLVDLIIADNGRGMTSEILQKALQLGESATVENRLNEHGFGLKNALATLSGGNGAWQMWTHVPGEGKYCSVKGPFRPKMEIVDDADAPEFDLLPSDFSTVIRVPVKLSFIQTLQGRGAKATDLDALRSWLIEHLGVLYRGFLQVDPKTGDNKGVITVHVGKTKKNVPTIEIPFAKSDKKYFAVVLDGVEYPLEYQFGSIDPVKRDELVSGSKAKFYYQGNIPTQGVDIRLGNRTIATRQFETIWKDKSGSQVSRHNGYNDFVGELIIPAVPRGLLTTVNNKTDFNLDDSNWEKIFEELNKFRPPREPRSASEAELRDQWIKMLKATNKDETVTKEVSVWPSGTKIDVYRKKKDGQIIIYEIKIGKGSPEHLYQLKMYWDGLVMDKKEFPEEAILLCSEFDDKLQDMANTMNSMPAPGSKGYNFTIEKLSDKGLG